MSRKPSILLLDNDSTSLLVRKELLELAGYQVYTATGIEEARQILSSLAIHLIISDLRVEDDSDEKDISGLTWATDVDRLIPRIILTGFPSWTAAREALRGRALDFIYKGDDAASLVDAVRNAFDQHVRENFSLQIEFAEGLTAEGLSQQLAEGHRQRNAISGVSIAEEVDDLLRRAFFDASRVGVDPLPFASESGLLLRINQSRPEGMQEPVIVKIGEREQIEREAANYRTYVAPYSITSGLQITEHVKTHHFGALIYTVIGQSLNDPHWLLWCALQIQWTNALGALSANDATLLQASASAITGLINVRLSSSLRRPIQQIGDYWVGTIDISNAFHEFGIPSELPLIFHNGLTIDLGRLDNFRHVLDQFANPALRISVLLLFGDSHLISEARNLLRERLQRPFAHDVVILGLDELRSLILDEHPGEVLKHLILSQVNLLSLSPFHVVGETPGRVFFGREAEIREITEHVRDSSYAIIGGRRIGKSSLIGRLHRVHLSNAGIYSVYHDCSATPSYEAFVATSIHNWKPEPLWQSHITFGELFRAGSIDEHLVLLLDEADKLVPTDRAGGWRLFSTLRALANSGRIQVVLSGERTLREALRDPTGPLFNFVNEMLLGPLTFRAVQELVTRPLMQLEIELLDPPTIVKHIYDFTSGHPNIVQRLCHRLIEYLNDQGVRHITLDDVSAVIEDPGFQRDDFLSTYWEAATSLEKIVSLVMAKNENIRTLGTVRQALANHCGLRPKIRDVDQALQSLVDLRSILRRTSQGYAFAVEAFPRVVKGTMTLHDMLEVLIEEYKEEGE